MTTSAVSVKSLTCEYLTNPLGIDVTQPRLSWKLASGERGQRQTAYQVLVAGTEQALAAGQGDLWDSGKVESDQSVHVVYDGAPMVSRMRCFWKVRVWDKDGQPSEVSEPARWDMGLLQPEDWQADWISNTQDEITDPESYKTRPAPFFRRTFDAAKPVESARVYLCGLGFYELSLNGERVGDQALDPPFTAFHKRVLYATHDVTTRVQAGDNALGVVLRNGWFNDLEHGWDFDTSPWRAYPRLRLQLHLTYEDGTHEVIVSDPSWKTGTGPILFDGLRNGEIYDARLEQDGWDTVGFDDSGWAPAVRVKGPAGVMSARMTPPIKVAKTVEPVSVNEPKPGVFVFDMGQNLAGWVSLTTRGPAGTRVTMTHGEELGPDGLVAQVKLCGHGGRQPFQKDTVILKGDGVETWEPRSTYHGFQYVEIEGLAETPSLASVDGKFVHTAFESAGSFECSNGLINRIQGNLVWGYAGNFHGMPTDCPHREKNGWTGDAHLAAEAGLMNFHMGSPFTKWLQDFADSQRASGEIPAIVPTGTYGFDWGNGPAWDSAFILIAWYLYVYLGDLRILEKHYDRMTRYMEFLKREKTGARPVIRWGLGDWLPPFGPADDYRANTRITSTSFYYVDAVILSKIAALLGKRKDRKKYRELAGAVGKTLNDEYLNPETGIYSGGTQTEQACALYQGFVEKRHAKKVVRKLLAEIKKHDGFLNTGMFGTKWMFRSLAEHGHVDAVLGMVTKTKHPSWGWQIEQGATTFWEHWNGEGSHNHPAFGDVSAWFYAVLAGIRPDPARPGFKHILIQPCPGGDLTRAEAEYECVYGTIRSSWRIDGDRFALEVTVPPNTTATVSLPVLGEAGVTEGGRPLEAAAGVTLLKQQKRLVAVAVQSGAYVFEGLTP